MPWSSRPVALAVAVLAMLVTACAAAPSPVAPGAPVPPTVPTTSDADIAAVRALSDAWFAAYKAGDAPWFEQNLADDFTEYSSQGTISKAQTVEDVRKHEVTFDVLEPLAEGRTFRASGDLAVETGLERFVVHAAEGKGAERLSRYTTVFVRRDGRWRGLIDHISSVAAIEDAPSSPAASPEMKKWQVWIGDWSLTGTAKDAPSGPEYKLEWQLHERWILGGAFAQVDQVWKGNGQQTSVLEVLAYDTARKVHTVSGFAGDGSTYSLTARFDGATVTEDGVSVGADGAHTTCRATWVFSPDGSSLSGSETCDQNGKRWTAFSVQGAKTKS